MKPADCRRRARDGARVTPRTHDRWRAITADTRVVAITAPKKGLPSEKASAAVKRFSFIAYGDTRNGSDGLVVQEAHGLVVQSLLAKADSMSRGPDPVRFVVFERRRRR